MFQFRPEVRPVRVFEIKSGVTPDEINFRKICAQRLDAFGQVLVPRAKFLSESFQVVSLFNLQAAIETAKYTKYANRKKFLKSSHFTQWVKCFAAAKFHFGPSFSRISCSSRFIPTAESRFKQPATLPDFLNQFSEASSTPSFRTVAKKWS